MTGDSQSGPGKLVLYDSLLIIGVVLMVLGAAKFMAFEAMAFLLFLAGSAWLLIHFRLHAHFLMLLALLLPFSVEYPLSENIKLFIPGEPMIAIGLFALFGELFCKPSLLKTLFSGESSWVIPFMASFLLALAFSTMKIVSLKFTVITLGYMLLFFLWQKIQFKERPDLFPRMLLLFSISQLAVLAYSIYQFSGYGFNTTTVKGIFRPFYKDHTIMGATSALLGVFWLLYLRKVKEKKFKMVFLVLGIIFIGNVFLSFSRAAVFSLLFSGLVWLAFQLNFKIRHLVLLAFAGLLLTAVYRQPLIDYISSNKSLSHDASASYLERLESSGNIRTDISNLERINRWYSGLKMARERPLTGFGPGTYQFKYIPFQNPQFMNRLTVKSYWHIPENSGGTAHSEYVLALSEMGIGGLVALLLLIGRWTWIAFNKSAGSANSRKEILIGYAVLSTYFFHGAFNNFLNTDKFAFLFWGFAAWMAANYELTKKERPENLTYEADE